MLLELANVFDIFDVRVQVISFRVYQFSLWLALNRRGEMKEAGD